MLPDRPLLTIAIPTYNRSACLARLLESLAPQLEGENRIELIISDNASPDDTRAVVKSFQEKGVRLHYIRSEENIGPDANFLKCFRVANGRYVWIFGDDDIILPGSLAKLLNILSQNEYDLVYVGFFTLSGPLATEKSSHQIEAEVIESAREMVKRANHSLTFISGNIINRERVRNEIERPLEELVGTNLLQLGWIFTALNNFRRGIHVTEPLIAAGDSASPDFNFIGVFGPNFVSITDRWLNDPSLRRIIFSSVLKTLMPYFLIRSRRISNALAANRSARAAVSSAFRSNHLYWLYNYPIITLPLKLAEAYWLIVRICNRFDGLWARAEIAMRLAVFRRTDHFKLSLDRE